jgi:hypothetical protein
LADIKHREDNFLGSGATLFYYSKKIEMLIKKESLNKKIKPNQLIWEILRDHFVVDIKECDPTH